MFQAMFKRRGLSGEKSPKNEENPMEAEMPGEDTPAQLVQAEQTPPDNLEASPAVEESIHDVPSDSDGKEVEEEQEAEDGSSSLASLFAQAGQDDESSVTALLDLVPDTTVQELLDNLEEIKGMLCGWLPEQ